MEREKKVYLLFSGGLDSVIAAKLLQNLGFQVVGVHITSPFFEKDLSKVKELADRLGIELKVVEAGEDYLEMLKSPVYGYGKNVNPCIDCKAYMLKKLKEVAGEEGIIATGEVLGQRPMSQRLDAFRSIEKLAGLRGRVLRPLSGKLLPETVYEREGVVDKRELLDLRGRSRKRYPEILRKLGLSGELPTPAGGCLLTEPSFAIKVKDLIEHDQLTWENVKLLKFGRHFRIGKCKLVVGRNREENAKIASFSKDKDLILKVEVAPSPVGLLRCEGEPEREVLETAAGIVARYSDAKREKEVPVSVYRSGKLIEVIKVQPNFNTDKYALKV